MKRITVYWLVGVAWLVLCFGCSSLKPSPAQHAAALTSPVPKKAPAYHDSPITSFVHGWLIGGEAPSPDFPQGIDYGHWQWYEFEWFFELIARCVNK